jgi:hypothetical protein
MPGDHLGLKPLERALLRRQAWQVQRVEAQKPPWRGQVPIWMLAPRIPATLRAVRRVTAVAPGCHAVETGSFSFVWIAANELPLREELIPFLIALVGRWGFGSRKRALRPKPRSGRPLDDFARWVAARRPPAWVLRMVQIVPMSPGLREEMLRYVPQTDDPEVRARQRQVAKILLDLNPDLRNEIAEDGHQKGIEEGLGLVYEQRLGRPLTDAEHRTLFERLTTLGRARLGSVVLSLTPEALAAWLADPSAT